MQFRPRALAALAVAATATVALAGCSMDAASASSSSSSSSSSTDWSTASSASTGGGMAALVKAAKAEGKLNIIAKFEKQYGITVNSANPNGSSADEIAAAKSEKGQSTAPDVFDLGSAVTQANLDMFAPYKSTHWNDLTTEFKDPKGRWAYDYTGLMSIGYDSSIIKTAPKNLKSLLTSAYKGKVAIKGDPTEAGEAAGAVDLAALENGGSASDIQAGIDYFGKLRASGNYQNVLPTQATVNSGETPVVIQWSYNNLAWGPAAGAAGDKNWKVVVPKGTALGSYYNAAINKDAPDPAAARLWNEFIFSKYGQNEFYASGAFPSTLAAMEKNGTVDKATASKVGSAPSDFVQLSNDQATKAAALLSSKWAATMGQ